MFDVEIGLPRHDEHRAVVGLEVDEAKLLGPARLEQLAKDQRMVSPKPEQVVNLNIKASEGTVAYNVTSKKVK